MAIFYGVTSYSGFLSIGVYLLFLSCGVVCPVGGDFACSGAAGCKHTRLSYSVT
jgi:hypothetical protein